MASALFRAVCAVLLTAVVPPGAQVAAGNLPPSPIDRLVVFGDSLSDPGNVFVVTREFEVRPFEPIPDRPYLIGRFRFANGPTWVEYLARDFRLFRRGAPALARPGVYTNYAFGSARARRSDPPAPFELRKQIKRFLKDFDGFAAPETLYVLWIGSNDLRDALAAEDPSIIAQAVQGTADGITKLYHKGARSFLVLNLPNIGDTPAIRALGPQVQQAAEQLSQGYNLLLEASLDLLDGLPNITIVRLDVFEILSDAVDNPASVGLTNVIDSCITPGILIGAICRQPRKYLFWDFVHPTTKAHDLLSEDARAILETVFFIAEPAF